MYYIVGCSAEYLLDGLIFSILYIFPKTYNVLGSIFYGWVEGPFYNLIYLFCLHQIPSDIFWPFFGIKAYANLKINWQQEKVCESPSDA